ncbi:hypothetical protein Bca4012_011876 [Brassica carinata]
MIYSYCSNATRDKLFFTKVSVMSPSQLLLLFLLILPATNSVETFRSHTTGGEESAQGRQVFTVPPSSPSKRQNLSKRTQLSYGNLPGHYRRLGRWG